MFPLYAIVDTSLCTARGLDPRDLADAFLRGGARLIQLRDKAGSSAERVALADDLVRRVRATGGKIVINDRADVARLCGADGVHLGQDDLTVDDARAVVGPDAIAGISTHDETQIAAAARTSASYIAIGPIYGTSTKDTGYSARGLDLVRIARATGKPVVAIGGITLDCARDVIAAGASSVAVISDLLIGDPEERVRRFIRRLEG
jgi:thiamine-phosphate pyrophosphorylase